jgi:hypothetical protein
MDLRAAVALVAAALALAGPVRAADPSELSVAETKIFVDDHLRSVPASTTLDYTYTKRGSLEAPIDDVAHVIVGPASAGGAQSVKVQYLSGTRALELADIDAANANPVILYFLEHDIREMHRLTGGSTSYFRKRIRMALAEGAKVTAPKVDVGSRRVAATQIRIAPYRDDPARSRYERFADKTYVFTLSDEIPGKVVELHSEVLASPAAAGAASEIVIAETLRFAGKR